MGFFVFLSRFSPYSCPHYVMQKMEIKLYIATIIKFCVCIYGSLLIVVMIKLLYFSALNEQFSLVTLLSDVSVGRPACWCLFSDCPINIQRIYCTQKYLFHGKHSKAMPGSRCVTKVIPLKNTGILRVSRVLLCWLSYLAWGKTHSDVACMAAAWYRLGFKGPFAPLKKRQLPLVPRFVHERHPHIHPHSTSPLKTHSHTHCLLRRGYTGRGGHLPELEKENY